MRQRGGVADLHALQTALLGDVAQVLLEQGGDVGGVQDRPRAGRRGGQGGGALLEWGRAAVEIDFGREAAVRVSHQDLPCPPCVCLCRLFLPSQRAGMETHLTVCWIHSPPQPPPVPPCPLSSMAVARPDSPTKSPGIHARRAGTPLHTCCEPFILGRLYSFNGLFGADR